MNGHVTDLLADTGKQVDAVDGAAQPTNTDDQPVADDATVHTNGTTANGDSAPPTKHTSVDRRTADHDHIHVESET